MIATESTSKSRLAAVVPAQRATRVDSLRALRED
jgi:hypothetical protein